MKLADTILPLPLNPETQPPALEIEVLEDLSAGTLIRIETDSLAPLQNWRAESLTLADGTGCEEVDRYTLDAHRREWAEIGSRGAMLTARLPRDVGKGGLLVLKSAFKEEKSTGKPTGMPPAMAPVARPLFARMRWEVRLLSVEKVDAPEGRPVSQPFGFVFTEGRSSRLAAIWKADGSLNLRYYDAYDNPVRNKAFLTVDIQGESTAEMIALSDDLPDNRLETGTSFPLGHRINVIDEDGLTCQSNPLPMTENGLSIYFGDIHWHCKLSCDGHRSLEDALNTARDEICLDFAGPADHIWSGGVFGEDATPEMQVDILRSFNKPGHFTSLPGAEYSCSVGHANFYCDSFENYLQVCRNLPTASAKSNALTEGEYDWETLVGAAIDGHTLLVPHHANTNSYVGEGVFRPDTGRPFWNAMTFPRGEEMAWIRGFEIYQVRGSFEDETPDPDWRIFHGGYGASARTALAKGYRFGFTAGTDNHSGFPSRSFTTGKMDGFTAIMAEELTPKALWNALNERRCYATTGARIVCDVTLNGHPIGSELKLAWDEPRSMRIRIHGTAPLEKVQVISAGVVLDEIQVNPNSPDLLTEWEDSRPGRPLHDVYYYLRIKQMDGNLAWLSPFWIDLKR